MKKPWKISFPTLLLLSFASGVILGTVTANLLKGELLEQIGYFNSIYGGMLPQGRQDAAETWVSVVRKRLPEFGIALLLGMTPFATVGFAAWLCVGGFAYGILLSVFTFQRGWLGIIAFGGTMMPHWLCYLVAWMILLAGSRKEYRKMKRKVWILLGAAIAAGIWMEAGIKINL